MPTVTLLKPASLNAGGRMWIRDVPVNVSIADAHKFRGNPRFKVEGLPGMVSDDGTGKVRPSNRVSLLNQVRQAIAGLSADDEHAWAADGMPNPYAVSFRAGFEVTVSDIAEVGGGAPAPSAPAIVEPDQAAETTLAPKAGKAAPEKKPKPVIMSGKAAAKAAAEPLDTGAARAAEEGAEEPGVEV